MTHENPIQTYLATLPEPKRTTLAQLRADILAELPAAEECISYGMPAFRVGKHVIAGFCAFKAHLSYFPHSGSVLPVLAGELGGYTWSKGTLQFAVDQPLPKELVSKLIAERMRQVVAKGR